MIVLVLIALSYLGYQFYVYYTDARAAMRADQLRQQQININRTQVHDALLSAGVDPHEVTSGFWYISTDENGDQSVAYFDPEVVATEAQELSATDLMLLTAQMKRVQISGAASMKELANDQLPPDLQFHNQLYNGQAAGAYAGTQVSLETAYASGKATADQLWQLSYMYEFEGNYKKRDEVNALSCSVYKVRCTGAIPIMITGVVKDTAGHPVQGAHVSVLSHSENKGATTNEKGEYSLSLSVLPMEKLRLSAGKRNFSEGIASLIVLTGGKKQYAVDAIVLGTPITVVSIDTVKHTVTDPLDEAHADGSFVLHATSSTYEIPAGAIVDRNGKPYRGVVDVYIYEFTRDTVPQSLITLDTFDQVMGYAGDLMQSYGMPYIQFFATDGTELDVASAHPMLLTYKIAAMDVLRANADKNPAGTLTDVQMQKLVDVSLFDRGFPVTRAYLVEQKLYTFPPFWVFDRASGVWDNVGIRVLDTAGTIQAPFYTKK
ncbi:MAG: hypothetical protein JWM46_32 [Candidatus Kaiserbacteria bacterium]|nr:hypothetical protein [Candidatus Kaiserbacteria bacterium]